jgi:ParB/RepB/Spo0J family partition protein
LRLTAAGDAALAAIDRANGIGGELVALPPGFVLLRHDEIEPDPDNARKAFPDIEGLAETLLSHGLKQPPVVWLRPDGRHQLIMGERRWRAWGLLIERGAWEAVRTEPCRLETADDRERMEAGLIENLQRVDLNHMELAEGFEQLGARFHLSNKVIAARVGRTVEYVQQHRRLTQLEPDDRVRVRDGKMAMHDALRVVAKPTPKSLGPRLTLMLAEVVAAIAANPAKGENYYGGRTEVQSNAGDDTLLQELLKRQVLNLEPCHYRDRRTYRHWI